MMVEAGIVAELLALQCLPITKRLAMWPNVLKSFSVAVVQHRTAIAKHTELAGKTAKTMKLIELAKAGMYSTPHEGEAAYLGACRAAESLLCHFGFKPIMVTVSRAIEERDAKAEGRLKAVSQGLAQVLGKMGGLLPWRPVITVLAEEEETITTWNGTTKTLALTIADAEKIRENVATIGLYTVLCGQMLPMMLTGPKPMCSVAEALSFAAMLGVQLGAADEKVEPKRSKPDLYRGAAKRMFDALCSGPHTYPALMAITEEAPRVLRMLVTDGAEYGWRVVCNYETQVYTILVT